MKVKEIPYQSVKSKLIKYWQKGASPGVFCGFDTLHEYYSMKLGSCTDWTGFPTSGKTQFLMELLINTSELYGWKHILFMPDVGDDVEIYADLIHKVSGKTFDKKYPNYIQEEEIYRHELFVQEHFLVIEKADMKSPITPIDFWEYCSSIPEYETGVVDSWKNLKHMKGKRRDDEYLDEVLTIRNELAEKHNKHFHTVIHPVKTEIENGKRRVPTAYDLKGGSSWFDAAKSIITIDRPDKSTNQVDFYVSKAKPRIVGKQGWDTMFFDFNKSRYYEITDKVYNSKKFAHKQDSISQLQPNTEFENEPF